jgi:hypothetical protein
VIRANYAGAVHMIEKSPFPPEPSIANANMPHGRVHPRPDITCGVVSHSGVRIHGEKDTGTVKV